MLSCTKTCWRPFSTTAMGNSTTTYPNRQTSVLMTMICSQTQKNSSQLSSSH
jgi:hypothetical protein